MRRRFEELMRQHHELIHCGMVPTEAAMGIASEAGEYLQLVRKWKYEDEVYNEGAGLSELGDVLHYLMLACYQHGITLEDLMHVNYLKMKAKEMELGEVFDAMMEQYHFGFLDSLLENIEAALEVEA